MSDLASKVKVSEGTSWVAAKDGEVPEGALLAGEDQGNDIFVARVEHEGSLVPGKLHKKYGKVYIGWDGIEVEKTSYEVLIAKADEVHWCTPEMCELPPNAIQGGLEKDGSKAFYIGRAKPSNSGRATVVGRVPEVEARMIYSFGGVGFDVSDYEVLVEGRADSGKHGNDDDDFQ